jgi:hypothetical protein
LGQKDDRINEYFRNSTFASAAIGGFIDKFGDNVLFTDYTHRERTKFLRESRTFQSFSEMLKKMPILEYLHNYASE